MENIDNKFVKEINKVTPEGRYSSFYIGTGYGNATGYGDGYYRGVGCGKDYSRSGHFSNGEATGSGSAYLGSRYCRISLYNHNGDNR